MRYLKPKVSQGSQGAELGLQGADLGLQGAGLGSQGAALRLQGADLGLQGAQLGQQGAELGLQGAQFIFFYFFLSSGIDPQDPAAAAVTPIFVEVAEHFITSWGLCPSSEKSTTLWKDWKTKVAEVLRSRWRTAGGKFKKEHRRPDKRPRSERFDDLLQAVYDVRKQVPLAGLECSERHRCISGALLFFMCCSVTGGCLQGT